MWEFNLEGPRTVQQFFGMTLKEMYESFFGSRIKCPDTTEDAGLNCNRPDTQVNTSATEHTILYVHYDILQKKFSLPGLAEEGGED